MLTSKLPISVVLGDVRQPYAMDLNFSCTRMCGEILYGVGPIGEHRALASYCGALCEKIVLFPPRDLKSAKNFKHPEVCNINHDTVNLLS